MGSIINYTNRMPENILNVIYSYIELGTSKMLLGLTTFA